MLRPSFQIQFLFRRRFPFYTDSVGADVSRAVREFDDPDLRHHGALERIADLLALDVNSLAPQEPFGVARPQISRAPDHPITLTPEQAEQLRAYLDAARDYRDLLHEMSDDDFWASYCAEQKREMVERENASKANDHFAFFNEPRAEADYQHWVRVLRWTPEEAVALSMEKDPRIVNSVTLKLRGLRFQHSAFEREYSQRLQLAERAIEAGAFSANIEPDRFLNWARQCGLGYPGELEILRRSSSVNSADQIEDKDKSYSLSSSDKKARNSLLRLLIAVVAAHYKFDPHSTSHIEKDLVDRILADMDRVQVQGLTEKTVRDWLQKAVHRARTDKPNRS